MSVATRRLMIVVSLVVSFIALAEACRANARLDWSDRNCVCGIVQ